MVGPEDNAGAAAQGVAGGGFVSSYLHLLDPKRRLTIPAEWREVVGTPPSLYVIPGQGGDCCLYVYPAREIMPRLQRLRNVRFADHKARSCQRRLASESNLVNWDSQGRIRISDSLLDRAKLTDEVKLIGAFDHFELWNPKEWDAAGAPDDVSMEDAFKYLDF